MHRRHRSCTREKGIPNLYVQSLHDMTEKYQELIHTMSEDDELIFHAELAQHY